MIRFDLRDFQRVAKSLNAYADQIPFALAQAMNDAAELARKEIVERTWPTHMDVRNARFMSAALTTKGERATKRRLRVAVYDKLGRGNLVLHEHGGSKRPRGTSIAVPSKVLQDRRTGRGVPKGLRPKTVPNSFKAPGKFGADVIYQRTGSKSKPSLKFMYSLRPSVPIRAEVPFHADFARVMSREIHRAFGPRLKAAMSSRRK